MPPTTHRRKLTQKELRAPDEFTTLIDNARDFFFNNLTQVIVSAGVVVAVGAIVIGVYYYERHRDTLASARFYDAITALNAGRTRTPKRSSRCSPMKSPDAGSVVSRASTSRIHILPTAIFRTRAIRWLLFWPRSVTRCSAASR